MKRKKLNNLKKIRRERERKTCKIAALWVLVSLFYLKDGCWKAKLPAEQLLVLGDYRTTAWLDWKGP